LSYETSKSNWHLSYLRYQTGEWQNNRGKKRVKYNDEMMNKGTPALQCIRTPAFSYPSNFLRQELNDKDVKKTLALSVLAVEVVMVTSPIENKKKKKLVFISLVFCHKKQ
jgi:hypothetical protein